MKVKKARKRLQRVNGLLTNILDGYTKADDGVHDLLDQAMTAVSDAMGMMDNSTVKKQPARAHESRHGVSSKKRAGKATAKNGGAAAVKGHSLRKSA